MGMGIEIREIQNKYLQELALEIDTSGISKKDGYMDVKELTIFVQKAQEEKNQYSQSDFEQTLGLFKSAPAIKPKRAELSWGEIGEIGMKKAKNFVKGMFCDENGFSLKRTLTTLGAAAAFAAVSAIPGVGPAIALTCGAVLGTYGVCKGTSELVNGLKEYYNAKTHDEAVQAMEKTMAGGVETGFSILALLGIRQCATKMSAKTKPQTQTSSQSQAQTASQTQTQPKPQQTTQTKPAETTKTENPEALNRTAENKVDTQNRTKTTKYQDRHTVEKFYNKSGAITKEIRTDVNGKKMTVEYKYDKDGFNVISKTETYEAGYVYQTNPKIIYNKGMIKETTFKNGVRKEVCTDGETLTTNWYDRKGEIIKQEFSSPDKNGMIKYERTNSGYKETFADGHSFERIYNPAKECYDEIRIFADGRKEVNSVPIVKIVW